MMDVKKERRQHPRVPAHLTVETAGPEGTELTLVTGNLSLGGFHCRVSRYIPKSTHLTVKLELPFPERSEWLTAEGEVVRVKPQEPVEGRNDYRLALQFTRLYGRDRQLLGRYLEQHYKQR
ncbi:MAG: PilZ domain-containing protein [Acidobacteriota bacterium]|nr:MAG: PilZ domain-containing protein [Acidobacteriota bacterium]